MHPSLLSSVIDLPVANGHFHQVVSTRADVSSLPSVPARLHSSIRVLFNELASTPCPPITSAALLPPPCPAGSSSARFVLLSSVVSDLVFCRLSTVTFGFSSTSL